MNVDETRHNDVAAQIVFNARGAPPPLALARRRVFDALPSGAPLGPQALRTYRARRTCSNVRDPIAVDHERALLLDKPGQHEIGARQDDHER